MLKTDKLTIYTHKGRKLLDSFTFVLNEGDKVALIGEEGNGKSSLLKIMAGIDVSSYLNYTGKVYADSLVAYLPQHLSEEDLNQDIMSYLGEEINYSNLYDLIDELSIGFDVYDHKSISDYSGGERVKIALLKTLISKPDILLMDEPSNDLDLKSLIWLEEFIKNSDMGIIFISHDETLLKNCAEAILHLEQLKRKSEAHITYAGVGYEEYVRKRNLFIERNNMIASKQKSELNKQLEKWRRVYQKVDNDQRKISRGDPHGAAMLKKKMHAVKSQQKNLERKKEDMLEKYEPEEAIDIFFEPLRVNPGKVIIDLYLDELKNSGKVLSKDVRLYVQGKDKICIIGENGKGKSTLIRVICEQLKDRDDLSVGYMPQNYDEVMDFDLSPVEFLWDGKDMAQRAKVQSHLGALRFTTEEMDHKIADLSEGQKCKILLLKLILDKNEVLILDEPTRNLSPLSGPLIRKILNDYDGCIIAVSHDRMFIDEVCNRVLELDEKGLKELL